MVLPEGFLKEQNLLDIQSFPSFTHESLKHQMINIDSTLRLMARDRNERSYPRLLGNIFIGNI